MLFEKTQCDRCRGTGIREHESFHLGANFFLLAIELALPIAGVVVPLYLLSVFGVGIDRLFQYWRVIAGICFLALLASLWLLPPILKGIVFTRCVKCGGSGKIKRSDGASGCRKKFGILVKQFLITTAVWSVFLAGLMASAFMVVLLAIWVYPSGQITVWVEVVGVIVLLAILILFARWASTGDGWYGQNSLPMKSPARLNIVAGIVAGVLSLLLALVWLEASAFLIVVILAWSN